MKHGEKIAPVAAALTGLATLACCLPMGFAAAAVTAGLSTVVAAYQPWFLGLSVVLLAVGLVQLNQSAEDLQPTALRIVRCVRSLCCHRAARRAVSTGHCGHARGLVALTSMKNRTTNVRLDGVGGRPRGCNGWYRFAPGEAPAGPACARDARFDVTSNPSSGLQSGIEPRPSHRPAVANVRDMSAGGLRSRIAPRAPRERADSRVCGVATHAADGLGRAGQFGPQTAFRSARAAGTGIRIMFLRRR